MSACPKRIGAGSNLIDQYSSVWYQARFRFDTYKLWEVRKAARWER